MGVLTKLCAQSRGADSARLSTGPLGGVFHRIRRRDTKLAPIPRVKGMRPRLEVPSSLIRLADRQAGALTREQVQAHMSGEAVPRLVREGRWRRAASGIYLLHTPPDPFETLAWVGVLAGGDSAMLGGRAAGFVQGICSKAPDEVTVLVPHSSNRRIEPPWRFVRRRHLPRARGLLPVTPPEWTVLDLCDVEPEQSVQWVTSAMRQRLVSPISLLAALHERARISRTPLPTRDLLEAMLADAQGLESPLEHVYATRVEQAHGLPRGVRQPRLAGGRRDVRYDGLLVELDGRLGHEDTWSIFRDMTKDNAASMEGYFSHRYGWHDCWSRPCETALQVATKLRQLGWSGQPHPCRDCRTSDLWRDFHL